MNKELLDAIDVLRRHSEDTQNVMRQLDAIAVNGGCIVACGRASMTEIADARATGRWFSVGHLNFIVRTKDWLERAESALQELPAGGRIVVKPVIERNQGHGHVFPRPDGQRARCGGPGICGECSRDEKEFANLTPRQRIERGVI